MPEHEKNRGESGVCSGSHRLDLVHGQLWHGKQEVRITGKVFAVLQYFIEHAGQLVSKDDLFMAVWPDTVVSDATLASCTQDLRQVLGDRAKKPRYIETVHGRGYRFIGDVVSSQQPVVSSQEAGNVLQSTIGEHYPGISPIGNRAPAILLVVVENETRLGETRAVFLGACPVRSF